ncbi:MAG: tetratricopeptide repeat protein [Vicinamibacteraceae bacterium]
MGAKKGKAVAAATLAPAAGSLWIDRPWIDLLIGCGGWSIPLLALSYAVVDRDVPRWSAVFYGLALACNYPHYMATIYRAYGQDDRATHRLYTHWLTAGLVALGVAAHAWFPLVPWLFTAYVMWSPWHYTGQNFGVLMMFLRRAGVDVSAEERRRLHLAFIASFVMLLAAFNAGASADPLVLSLGLPAVSARIIEAGAGLTFLVGGIAAFAPIARRAPGRALVAPLTLYATQALWFVVPVAVNALAAIDTPQTRYSSGMLAVMHSAQYLWITRYFARRDAEQASRAGGWSPWRYWTTLVAGGIALFLPVPWLASYGWHLDFTTSVFIVAAIVNLHHFMIDGVVWKLRNPRVGRVLVRTDTGTPDRRATAPPATPRPLVTWAWRGALVAGLVALAVVDQWRYVLAIGNGARERLVDAARLNPYDSGTYLRLSQAESAAGDPAAAAVALRRAVDANPHNPALAGALVRRLIEAGQFADASQANEALLARWPDDVDALVNAGVLADRRGDAVAAERWWTTALERDPSQRRVHLYLGERLDARRATRDAIPHYRRYLELVAKPGAHDRPPASEIVAIVVKYGDALARDGQIASARTQYDLAIRMAGQTGLSDLGALASERRQAIEATGSRLP